MDSTNNIDENISSLYIDTREKKLLPHITINYTEKQLELGDIFIDSPNYKIMIERKTITDFNASLQDGRYRNQKLRLLEWRNMINDDVIKKIIYILEDNGDTKDKSYWGAIINAALRDNIFVIQSISITKTAELIEDMKKKIDENKISSLKNTKCDIHLEGLKKGDYSTPENFYIGQLTLIPGISKTIAIILVETFPTLRILMNTIQENLENETITFRKRLHFLSNIKINNRRLGEKLAEKICNYLLPN